jgi:hypothetical protein
MGEERRSGEDLQGSSHGAVRKFGLVADQYLTKLIQSNPTVIVKIVTGTPIRM